VKQGENPKFQIQVVEVHVATLMSNDITIGNIPLWLLILLLIMPLEIKLPLSLWAK